MLSSQAAGLQYEKDRTLILQEGGSLKEDEWTIDAQKSTAAFWTQDGNVVSYPSLGNNRPTNYYYNLAYVGPSTPNGALEVQIEFTDPSKSSWQIAGVLLRGKPGVTDTDDKWYACLIRYTPNWRQAVNGHDNMSHQIQLVRANPNGNMQSKWQTPIRTVHGRPGTLADGPYTLKISVNGDTNTFSCQENGETVISENDDTSGFGGAGQYGFLTHGGPATFTFSDPSDPSSYLMPFRNDEHQHCVRRRLCLNLLSESQRSNSTFMCLCVYQGTKLVRNNEIVSWEDDTVEACDRWKACLHAHRAASETVMVNLLNVLADQNPSSPSPTSLIASLSPSPSPTPSLSSSFLTKASLTVSNDVGNAGLSDVSQSGCMDPTNETTKQELVSCNCLAGLVQGCGDPFEQNQPQCLHDLACCHPNVCANWRSNNCGASGSVNCTRFDPLFSTAAFGTVTLSAYSLSQARLTRSSSVRVLASGLIRRSDKGDDKGDDRFRPSSAKHHAAEPASHTHGKESLDTTLGAKCR